MLGSIGMGGRGLLALYCVPHCTGLLARLLLPVATVSVSFFALALGVGRSYRPLCFPSVVGPGRVPHKSMRAGGWFACEVVDSSSSGGSSSSSGSFLQRACLGL
jgi:hypothetical protein